MLAGFVMYFLEEYLDEYFKFEELKKGKKMSSAEKRK